MNFELPIENNIYCYYLIVNVFLSQANASPLEYKTSFRTRFDNYYKGDLLNLTGVYRSVLINSLHRGVTFTV